jgi:hypothetical protein
MIPDLRSALLSAKGLQQQLADCAGVRQRHVRADGTATSTLSHFSLLARLGGGGAVWKE